MVRRTSCTHPEGSKAPESLAAGRKPVKPRATACNLARPAQDQPPVMDVVERHPVAVVE